MTLKTGVININIVLEAIEEYLKKPKGTLYCYTSTIDTRIPAIKKCTLKFYENKNCLFSLESNEKVEEVNACYSRMYKEGIVKLLNYFNNETSKN